MSVPYSEPGGIDLDELAIDDAGFLPLTITPTLLTAPRFFQLLLYTGGVSDVFCVSPVLDLFYVAPVPDLFTVQGGRTEC